MSKIINTDIIALGFVKEMFRKTTEGAFTSLIDDVIAEQSLILSGRVGSSVYDSVAAPIKDYVKRAEKCLVAAELVQRRINVILGNTTGAGQEINISHEGAQKKAYADEAERLILKVAGDDYSGEVVETDHFESVSDTDITVRLV